MGVAHAGVVERVQEPRQERVPDVFVERRHRAVLDFALEPAPHHHVGVALHDLFQQPRELPEVVRRVGVPDDDVLAAAALERVPVGVPVARFVRLDDDRTLFACDRRGAVGRVVADDDLRAVSRLTDRAFDEVDTLGDALLFVHRRHNDADGRVHVGVGPDEKRLRLAGLLYWVY